MAVLQNDRAVDVKSRADKLLFGEDYSKDVATNFSFDHDTDQFNTVMQSYFVPGDEQVTSKKEPVMDSYYNDTNPISSQTQTFRPKIFGQNLEEINFEKIAEVAISDTDTHVLNQVSDTDTHVLNKTESDFDVQMKLNHKGLIAIVSFFAVVAMIIALVIVNSVSIGNANGRIAAMTASNAATAAIVAARQEQVDNVRATSEDIVMSEIGSGQREYLGTPDRIVVDQWAAPVNPDASSNFFDWLSRLFSGIFR
jgi:hypothetical protein